MARPPHVLITGGSRGIGLAIAQLFAKNAYRCTLISRSEEHLKAAVATLQPLPSSTSSPDTVQASRSENEESKPSTPHLFANLQHGYIAGNITHNATFWTPSPTQPFAAHLPKPSSTKTAPTSSRIDVVINCAGRSQAKLFSAQSEEEIDDVINANLSAMMHGTRFLIRYVLYPQKTKNSKGHNQGANAWINTYLGMDTLNDLTTLMTETMTPSSSMLVHCWVCTADTALLRMRRRRRVF